MFTITKPFCCGWLAVLIAAFATAQSFAGGGGVAMLPLPGNLNTSGVQVVIDSRWVDATGYRPVRVEIIPLKKPATRDRQFRVTIKPQTYYGQSRDAISQIIELEEGSMKATASIAVPQDSPWHACIVDVHEDGRLHDDLSGDHLSWPRGNIWEWNEAAPGILVIDPLAPTPNQRESITQLFQSKNPKAAAAVYDKKLPDIRNLVRRFPGNNQAANNGQFVSEEDSKETTSTVQMLFELKDTIKAEVLPPSELPERWIEFTCLDIIIIKLSDLADLAKQKPKTFRAIAEWARAGHTLLVYETGERFTGLTQIEKLLQLPPLPKADEAAFRAWKRPDKKTRNDNLRSNVTDNRYPQTVYTQPQPGGTPGVTIVQPPEEAVDEKWAFVTRTIGLGNVLAFDSNPFPGTQQDWSWALNALPGNQWNPTQRLGTTMQQRNEDFWNFLIPGTGQAPVLSFMVFITLFVVAIGPVNYYMLQRRKRLYMVLITVPAGALLVTASLFLYAILTDGFGVKSRVRSYTAIDQRAGVGSSTSRQAYYASLVPSKGLMFEDDTVIHPFMHEPMKGNGQRAMRRIVHWSDRDQQLKGGYMSSRTLSQLLVNKSGATKAKLQVGAKQGKQLVVTNDLEATLAYLLVTDDEGNYFAGQDIQPGEAKLAEITINVAATDLSQRLHLVRPEFPEGYDERMHDSQFRFFNFGPRYYGVWGRNVQTSQAASLLERKLARFGHLANQPLEPKSYVAFADQSPLVPMGARTKQQGSLHVIEGSY